MGDTTWFRMTNKQITQAINRYARRHTFYARTVRVCTSLYGEAMKEWRENFLIKQNREIRKNLPGGSRIS